MNQSQQMQEALGTVDEATFTATIQKMIKEQGGIDRFLGHILLPIINEMNERKFPTKLISGFQSDLVKMTKPIRGFEGRQ